MKTKERILLLENKVDLLMRDRDESIKDSWEWTKEKINETDYLLSSKANKESLEKALKEFEAEVTMTPKTLLELGFKEEYQLPIDGEAGYLYYEYNLHGVELLSTTLDDKEFFVFTQNDYEIHSLKKLKDLITSLKEL